MGNKIPKYRHTERKPVRYMQKLLLGLRDVMKGAGFMVGGGKGRIGRVQRGALIFFVFFLFLLKTFGEAVE